MTAPAATTVSLRAYRMFIGGEWVEALDGGRMEVVNPATGERLATVPRAGAADVDRAVRAARESFRKGVWANKTPAERAAVLWRWADEVEKRSREIATLESLQAGKPFKLTYYADLPMSVDTMRFFAGAARHLEGKAVHEYIAGMTSMIRRDPVGVVGSIAPWNYPFMMAVWKVMPALAAGNSVVLKPASLTPLTSLLLAEAAQAAGVPAGVLNVITGPGSEVGAALCRHPDVDMISLTGDTETGSRIMEQAAPTVKRLHLELGGKAPFIVLEDADIEAAARGAVAGAFVNNGQDCTAATRAYVQRGVYDRFLGRLVELTRTLRLGDPVQPTTDIGPLISAQQLEKVDRYVQRALAQGARAVVGGKPARLGGALSRGHFYEPTVIVDVRQEWEIVQKELFGPVLVVLPFDTYEEAIALANDTEYGLAASIWTRDVAKSMDAGRRLRYGTVWVNEHIPLTSEMPHGGFARSGFGKDMSMYAFEEYTVVKHVMVESTGQTEKAWHFCVFGDPPQEGS